MTSAVDSRDVINPSNGNTRRSEGIVFAGFLFVAFILRFPSFLRSVVDWDESLYLLMARSILAGEFPYVEIWDHKPPGIYYLFVSSLAVFGDSILSIRILSCLAVAFTSYLLYRLATVAFSNGKKIGIISGILYIVFTLGNGGLAANTEIFLAPLVTLSFLALLTRKSSVVDGHSHNGGRLFTIGLLMGLAFEIKYVVLFELLAILAVILYNVMKSEKMGSRGNLLSLAKDCSIVLAAFCFPFVLVSIVFWRGGHFGEYFYANVTANSIHTVTDSLRSSVKLAALAKQVLANSILSISLVLLPLYLNRMKRKLVTEKNTMETIFIWLFASLTSIIFMGLQYPHYYIQVLPPLCVLSAHMIVNAVVSNERIHALGKRLLFGLFFLVFTTQVVYYSFGMGARMSYMRMVKGIKNWGDLPAAISEYLNHRIERNSLVYVYDYQPIIYYLTHSRVPSKYVFPMFIWDEHFSKVAAIDPIEELASILDKRPEYIILKDQPHQRDAVFDRLERTLNSHYIADTLFEGVALYNVIAMEERVRLYKFNPTSQSHD